MISIVMPVYNAGEFLKESITSLLIQTYSDFEVICVNDSSTDILTKRLLQEYEKNDKRIKVITLERNVGAAEARNIGMKVAYGDYIMFLDADDIFDNTMLNKMYECISENNADICICGYRTYLNNEKTIGTIVYPKKKDGVTDRVFKLNELSEDGLLYWTSAPWNKLCKKNFLIQKDIYFQSLNSSNDVFFSCICAICAERIVYCQKGIPLIKYRNDTNNQISANRNPIDFFEAISFLLNKIGKKIELLEFKQVICFLMLGIIGNMNVCKDELKNRRAYELVQSYLQINAGNLLFDNKKINNMYIYFKREEYDSNWFNLRGDFYLQLKEKEEIILKYFKENIQIVIWGNGQRSNALQRLLNEKNVELNSILITDIKNKNLGEKTLYGYEIISTELIDNIADIIIATNKIIYEYLIENYRDSGIEIIDLTKYCPFE